MGSKPRKPKREHRAGDNTPPWWDEEAQRQQDFAVLRDMGRTLLEAVRYCVAEIRSEWKRRRGRDES